MEEQRRIRAINYLHPDLRMTVMPTVWPLIGELPIWERLEIWEYIDRMV